MTPPKVGPSSSDLPTTIMTTILCSHTTNTHSCRHHSIQTVHRCDRDNCVYMAYTRESSTELCDFCKRFGRPNPPNMGGFNAPRQQVPAGRVGRNPRDPQQRRRRQAQLPQMRPRKTMPGVLVRGPPIRNWRGVLRAAVGVRGGTAFVIRVGTMLGKVWGWFD